MSEPKPGSYHHLFLTAKKKEQEADQVKDRVDQPDRIETTPKTDLVQNGPSPIDLAQNEPSPKQTKPDMDLVQNRLGPKRTRSKTAQVGSYRVPNFLDDEIMPTLGAAEQSVLRRLYRLSYGFNREITDPVSVAKLAEKCNLGGTTLKRALKGLEDRGLIVVHPDSSHRPTGGNRYTVLTGFKTDLVQNGLGSEQTQSETDHIKDHDHDLNNTSHHQRETMTTYQSITGNNWTKKDESSYQQIAHISLDHIAATMRQVLSRAPQKPATLAYFVKEILSPTPVNPGSRAAKRAQMERIIREVKDAHRHINGYLISDWSADTKQACAEQGIVFDNDLFEELTRR